MMVLSQEVLVAEEASFNENGVLKRPEIGPPSISYVYYYVYTVVRTFVRTVFSTTVHPYIL